MGMQRNGLRRGASRGRVGDTASTGSRKKKQNVMEIDGVLWALDEHGNPLKRLRKKNRESGGGGEAHHSSGGSTGAKRIKKNIIEIDGSPWLCDDNGKPIKKLRKKVKEGEEPPARSKSRSRNGGGGGYDSDGASSRGSNPNRRNGERRRGRSRSRHGRRSDSDSSTSDRRRGKSQGNSLEKLISSGESSSTGRRRKKVIEINGQLWACDEQGNPVKKVRRKGDPKPSDDSSVARQRGRSVGARDRDVHQGNNQWWSTSRSEQPSSSFTDAKGRKHVFDEFGNETVYDRNGKKLRKKGEPKPGNLLDHVMQSTGRGSLNDQKLPKPAEEKRELEFDFNNLWGDAEGTIPKAKSNVDVRKSLRLSPPRSSIVKSHTGGDLGDPDELDRRNKMLMEELRRAKEKIVEWEEQAEKEKSKNLKAQSEMMDLKGKFSKASSELEDLRCKVYDLTSEIQHKEKQLAEGAPKADVGTEGIAELEAEKDNLASKLELERASAQQEIKKKEEELAKMNREMGILRNEVEMLITGRKGNEVDPTLKRLQDEKDEVEQKYTAEKEQNEAKIKSLEEMIEALETVVTELNKQSMNNASGGNSAYNARNNIHTRTNRRDSKFERKAPEASKSFEGSWASPGALFGRGRFRQNNGQ